MELGLLFEIIPNVDTREGEPAFAKQISFYICRCQSWTYVTYVYVCDYGI